MKTCYSLCFLVVVMFLLTPSLEAQQHLVLSRVKVAPRAYVLMGVRVLEKAYSKLGLAFEFNDLPAERSLVYANDGVTDGEFVRVSGIEAKYPNLVMIPVPIVYEDVVIYTKKAEFEVQGWHSLSPYIISFIRGFKLAEAKTAGMSVVMVNTVQQAFLMLNAGRNDVVVDLRSAQYILKQLNVSDIKILEPSLQTIVQYHYLHKRHKALAAKLEAVLKRMEQEGEMKRIQENAFQEFLDSYQK